jgi:tRNA nucleotidyltransferase (CCA-adding enzyme)
MTLRDADPISLRARFFAQLPDPVRLMIERLACDGDAHGVYAVGGAVRDLVLGRPLILPLVDIDLTTGGDAIDLVRGAVSGVKITAHERFRTASFTIRGANIDVATARSEIYTKPGALPRVEPADIETDLRRRDFSINAMALRLDGEPRLLDPVGGMADIDSRRVRVLHARSFEDDATRIFRAIRHAARLEFTLEAETQQLLEAGLGFVASISGARLRRELDLMLLEPSASAALESAAAGGALGAIQPALRWDEARSAAWVNADLRSIPRLPFGFALLTAGTSLQDAAEVVERLRLPKDESGAVLGLASMPEVATMLRRPDAKPSGVVVLLDRYPAAAVAAYAVTAGDQIAGRVALRYLAEWRHVRPLLHGDELIALGVPAGPQVHQGLQLIRAARLDGWATDEGDERALALRFAKSIRDSATAAPGIEQHSHGF